MVYVHNLLLFCCGQIYATNPTTPAAVFESVDSIPNGLQPLTEANFTSIFPIVCTEDGCVEGRATPGYQIDEYESFFGIPYAEPPIGKLRFSVSHVFVI